MCDLHACVRTVGILFNTHTHIKTFITTTKKKTILLQRQQLPMY